MKRGEVWWVEFPVANADDLATVAKARLGGYVTTLPAPTIAALERALKFAPDLA